MPCPTLQTVPRTLPGLALAPLLLLSVHSLGAQDPLAPAELRRVVEVIAHDSMAGRRTPSPGLERSAQYVAARFRAAGLAPLGDDTTFFQRFPVVETTLDASAARAEMGSLATWRFRDELRYGGGGGRDPSGVLRAPAVAVGGRLTQEAARALGVEGKIVLYRGRFDRSVFALGGAGATGVIVPGRQSDSAWAAIWRDSSEWMPSVAAAWDVWTERRPTGETRVRFIPFLQVRAPLFDRLLHQAGIDTSALQAADSAPKLAPLGVEAALHFDRRIDRVSWPANVVGVLPGSDPLLRHEYVVVSAHLDGLGRAKGGPPGPAGILNGADDDASGIAALVQLAATLGSAPRRPRRSVIFLAVSGEEIGLLGSDFFAGRPPVPVSSLVANVNMDMVGRARGDTVYVTGRAETTVGAAAERAIRRGGTRGLVILGEDALERRYPGEQADERSDHANFRRRGVPAIHFFTGWHEDYHEPTDDAERLNYDALSRIARVALAITIEVANEVSLRRPAHPVPAPRRVPGHD